MPVWGSPWHLIDPTHVRGFHPLNFDYFIQGRELYLKFGCFYFDFAFRSGQVLLFVLDLRRVGPRVLGAARTTDHRRRARQVAR